MDLIQQLRAKGATPEEIAIVEQELAQVRQPSAVQQPGAVMRPGEGRSRRKPAQPVLAPAPSVTGPAPPAPEQRNVASFAQPSLDPEPAFDQPWSSDKLKSVLDQMDAKGATREEKDEIIKAAGHDSSRLTNYNPTVRDRMGAAVQDTAIQGGLSAQRAGDLAAGFTGSRGTGTEQMGLVDLVPGPANVLAHQDAQKDFEQGQNVMGVLNEVAAALPAGKAALTAAQAGIRGKTVAVPPTPQRLSEKAAEVGVSVPRVLDPNPNPISRTATNAAGRAAGVPFVGNPLAEKLAKSRQALDARVTQQAAKSGPAEPTEIAGEGFGTKVSEWIRTTSKDEVTAAYEVAKDLIPKNFRGQLTDLSKVARALRMRQAESHSTHLQPVLEAIENAIASPHGITIDGAQELKLAISARGNPGAAVAKTGAEAGFKQAAGALNRDIDRMIKMAGGNRARKAVNQAKQTFKKHQRIRQAIEKVVGKGVFDDVTGASGEKIISRIHGFARDSASGDAVALTQLRKAVDEDTWKTMVRAIDEKMGLNAAGDFDPLRWSKGVKSLTPTGRNELYGKELATENVKLANVMQEYVRVSSRIGNPSQSGNVMAGGAVMAGALTDGGLTVLGILKGRAIMSYMGNPRVVRAARRYVHASKNVLDGRASPTAVRNTARALAIQVELAGGDATEVMESFRTDSRPTP